MYVCSGSFALHTVFVALGKKKNAVNGSETCGVCVNVSKPRQTAMGCPCGATVSQTSARRVCDGEAESASYVESGAGHSSRIVFANANGFGYSRCLSSSFLVRRASSNMAGTMLSVSLQHYKIL